MNTSADLETPDLEPWSQLGPESTSFTEITATPSSARTARTPGKLSASAAIMTRYPAQVFQSGSLMDVSVVPLAYLLLNRRIAPGA
jgi:hypothetical protein